MEKRKEIEITTVNSMLPQLAVMYKTEAECFYPGAVQVDSFML